MKYALLATAILLSPQPSLASAQETCDSNAVFEKMAKGGRFLEMLYWSAEDVGGAIDLDASDPLWQALAKPGTDTPAESRGGSSTTVGVLDGHAAKLKKFKAACGL